MKRPLFICFVLYATAILVFNLTNGLFVAAAICAALIIISLKICTTYKTKTALIFPIFFIAGLIFAFVSARPANMDIEEIARQGGHVVIEGIVHDAVMSTTGMQVLTIITESIDSGGERFYERLRIRAVPRTEDGGQSISIGSRLRLSGTLWTLQPARNPGGFSELNHLGARRYDYTIRVESWQELGEIGTSFSARYTLRGLRERIVEVYYTALPEEKAGILAAMVTGERSGITEYVRNLYRDSGIFHVLVVSGMHISILGLFVDTMLRKITTIKAAAFITLAFLFVYCIFTGASTSTVRAVIMASVLVFGKLFQREPDLVSSASLAGLIMLFYEPRWLFDIGFQYSFSAVLGLGFFMRPMSFYIKQRTGLQTGIRLRIMEVASSSLIVFIATIPVQIYHFNQLITYSVFVNLLILPLLSFILIPGFIMGIVGLVSIEIAMVFSGVIYFLLAFYEQVSLLASRLPHAQILIATPHYLWAMAFMGILAGLWYLFASGVSYGFKLRAAGAVIAGYIVLFGVYSALPRAPIMIKLDVGQGDAVVIERYGEVFIVDGGGWPLREIGQNTGDRIIAPYLARRGIRRIDAIFVSHLHRDHVVGAIELLWLKDVERIYLPVRIDKSYPIFAILEEAAYYNDVEMVFVQAGDMFRSAGGISFMVLSPSGYHRYPSTNEASMVLYAYIDGMRIMFTGDIGMDTERVIAQRFSHIQTDILKVAHHGSRFSTSDEFLDAARPQTAIAGVGRHNVFGHPHPTVVDRLAERGIEFYSTHTHGAITINLRTGSITTMIGDGR